MKLGKRLGLVNIVGLSHVNFQHLIPSIWALVDLEMENIS